MLESPTGLPGDWESSGDGDVGAALEDDGPSEFWDTKRSKRLWIAVLWRSIADWVLYKADRDVAKKRLWAESNSWLFYDKSTDVGSFSWICMVLDRDVDVVRAKIKTLRKKDAKRIRGRRR